MQCDFTTKCTCSGCVLSSGCSQNASYSDAMVSDQIIVGSYDKDCLADVLARNQTLKTFDEKFHLIQAHEEDKRAQSHLNTSSILTHKSTYQQAKKRSYLPQKSGKLVDQRDKRHPQPKTSPASRSGCSGCGSQSQGWGTLLPRNENCPHWLTVHRKCKKTGHIKAVCSSCSSVTQIEDVPPESEVASILDDISTLFSMETDHVQSGHADTTFPHMEWVNDRFVTSGDTSSMISIIYPDSENIPPIPHMVWSQGKFVPCPPKKPRWIYLNIEPLTESHSDVGLNLKLHWKNVRSGTVLCLADTLGISVDSLLPTRYEYQEESAGSEWHHHGEIWKRISLIQSAAVHMWQHMRTLSVWESPNWPQDDSTFRSRSRSRKGPAGSMVLIAPVACVASLTALPADSWRQLQSWLPPQRWGNSSTVESFGWRRSS